MSSDRGEADDDYGQSGTRRIFRSRLGRVDARVFMHGPDGDSTSIDLGITSAADGFELLLPGAFCAGISYFWNGD